MRLVFGQICKGDLKIPGFYPDWADPTDKLIRLLILVLALIVAFSLGLASTITLIGLIAVLTKRVFGRLSLDGRIVRTLPAVSALAILAAGVVLTVRAIPAVV